MITVSNVYLQYGDRVLFDHINLVIAPDEKVGLVGRNGAGKSTLLKMLASEQTPDSGQIDFPNGSSIGFLHQEMSLPQERTVMAETMTAFEEVQKLEKKLADINVQLGERTDYETDSYMQLLQDLADTTDRLNVIGGQNAEAEAERVLTGLGFSRSDFDKPTHTLSGGWQMRIVLAKMLLQQPDFLFLDEPTNHLDIESIIWLEEYLQQYAGAMVLISHDKQFLDNTTKRTVEIEMAKVFDYKAPYSKYLQLREERREKLEASFKNQQKVIAEKERTITRFMAKATKTKQAQSMLKQLNKMERIEMDEADTSVMKLRMPPAPRSGQVVWKGDEIVKQYGDKMVLNGVDFQIERAQRVAFVGQNGQGKTTLARIIVGNLEASDGDSEYGHNVQLGYYAQDQADALNPKQTLLESMEQDSPPELRTKLRNILGSFMFSGEDVDKKVSVLSGGERARLALAKLLLHPFNLLILDEPTNHLDILSKEVLKKALMEFDGSMIVVSHDRDFLSGLTDRTIEFRDKQLYNYLGDVNHFLEKRKLDNMRAVEMRDEAKESAPVISTAAPKPELSREERKQLMRAVSSAEKKVDKLEKEIQKIELKMADPAFYESSSSDKEIAKYKQMKSELTEAMESWESATMEWEERS